MFGHAPLQSLVCWQVEKSTERGTSGNSKRQQPNRLRDKVKLKSYSCRCNLNRDLNKALNIRQHRTDTKHRSKQATAQAERQKEKQAEGETREGWMEIEGWMMGTCLAPLTTGPGLPSKPWAPWTVCKELEREERWRWRTGRGEVWGEVSEAVTRVPHKHNTSFDGGVTCWRWHVRDKQ